MITYEEKRTKERRKQFHLKKRIGLFTLEMFKLRNNLEITFRFKKGWGDRRK